MQRKRLIKQKNFHYCIFVNRQSANYNEKYVKQLTALIRKKGGYFSLFDTSSELALYNTAMKCAGLKPWHRGTPQNFTSRGRVTGLIACGGDGTINTVGRVALKSGIALGLLPFGKLNNFAKAFYGTEDSGEIIKFLVKKNFVQIDVGRAGKYMFFSSLTLGFFSELTKYFKVNNPPRFGMGWNKLGLRLIEEIEPYEMVIKVDAFRFEVAPLMVNVNLLSYSAGISVSPASQNDDTQAEVIFDLGEDRKIFGSFLKDTVKNKYQYGADVKLFRGTEIMFENMTGIEILLDGTPVKIKDDSLRIAILDRKLNVISP